MELFDLHGKVAIVTGGNGGIGLGIARGLGQAGATIAVAARNAEKTRSAVEHLEGHGVRALGLQTDVTDQHQVEKMVADTVQAFGGIDILIANAGMSIRKTPETYSLAEWTSVVATNLNAVFACCHAVYPQLTDRGGGKIVTIGSMSSVFGMAMGAPYAATKGGVVQLTKSLASAWAGCPVDQESCLRLGQRQHSGQLHSAWLDRYRPDARCACCDASSARFGA